MATYSQLLIHHLKFLHSYQRKGILHHGQHVN